MQSWSENEQPLQEGQLNDTAKKLKYRSSDARWRTNLRVSFEVLKDTLCPDMDLETFGKNGRKILLERSLDQIQTLEKELSNKGLDIKLVRSSFAELEKQCFDNPDCLKAFSRVFGRPINLTSSQRRPHKRRVPKPPRTGKAKRKIDFDAVADDNADDNDEVSAASSSATCSTPAAPTESNSTTTSTITTSTTASSTPKKCEESTNDNTTIADDGDQSNFVDLLVNLPDLSQEECESFAPLTNNAFGDILSSPSTSSFGLSHLIESQPIDYYLQFSPRLDLFETLER